jgi:hypothetical protein
MSTIRTIVKEVVSKPAQMAVTIMFFRYQSKQLENSNFVGPLANFRDHNFHCRESS